MKEPYKADYNIIAKHWEVMGPNVYWGMTCWDETKAKALAAQFNAAYNTGVMAILDELTNPTLNPILKQGHY